MEDGASPTSPNEGPPPGPPSHVNGRFAPGNKLGKGNPLAKRQAYWRKVWDEANNELRMQAVAKAVFAAAEDGDMAAARLYLEYSLGKPKQIEDERDDADAGPMVIGPPEVVAVAG